MPSHNNKENKKSDESQAIIRKFAAKKILNFMKRKRDFINHTSALMLPSRESSKVRFSSFYNLLPDDYRLLGYGLQTISDDPFLIHDFAQSEDYSKLMEKKYFPNQENEVFKRLMLTNLYSGSYARFYSENHSRLRNSIINKFNEQKPNSLKKAIFLVNGVYCLEKLKSVYDNRKQELNNLSIEAIPGSGLAVITCAKGVAPPSESSLNLTFLGMNPNPLDLIQFYTGTASDVEVVSQQVEKINLIHQFQKQISNKLNNFSQVSTEKTRGGKLVFHLIFKLLTNLKDSISRINEKGSKNEINIANDCIIECGKLIDYLIAASFGDQLNRQCEIYRLVIEELQVLLLLDNDYSLSSDQAILERHRNRGYEFTEKMKVMSMLTSSGMDSISTAIAALSKFYSEQSNKSPQIFSMKGMVGGVPRTLDAPRNTRKIFKYETFPSTYFELDHVLSMSPRGEDNAVVRFCTYEGSSHYHPSDLAHVDERQLSFEKFSDHYRCKKKSNTEFETIIIDMTIECQVEVFNQFLKKNEEDINNGNLNIIICKSFQKYESLGTGKLMSGELTIINSGHEKFNKLNNYIQKFSHSILRDQDVSSRLAKHLINYTSEDVISLEKIALSNMNFVMNTVLKSDQEQAKKLDNITYLPHSPLIMIHNDQGTKVNLMRCGVRLRRGFAHLESTYDSIPMGVRISMGIESESRLFEQFYMLNFYKDADSERLLQKFLESLDLPGNEKINHFINSDTHELDYAQIVNCLNEIASNKQEEVLLKNVMPCLISLLTAYRDNIQLKSADILYGYIVDHVLLKTNITPDGRVYFAKAFLLRKSMTEGNQDYFNNHIEQIKKCLLLLPPIERVDCLINMPSELFENQHNRNTIAKALDLSQTVQEYFLLALLHSGKNDHDAMDSGLAAKEFILHLVCEKISKNIRHKVSGQNISNMINKFITHLISVSVDTGDMQGFSMRLMKFFEGLDSLYKISKSSQSIYIDLIFEKALSSLEKTDITKNFDISIHIQKANKIIQCSDHKLSKDIIKSRINRCFEGELDSYSTDQLNEKIISQIFSEHAVSAVIKKGIFSRENTGLNLVDEAIASMIQNVQNIQALSHSLYFQDQNTIHFKTLTQNLIIDCQQAQSNKSLSMALVAIKKANMSIDAVERSPNVNDKLLKEISSLKSLLSEFQASFEKGTLTENSPK